LFIQERATILPGVVHTTALSYADDGGLHVGGDDDGDGG